MRKMFLFMMVTLDGFMEGENHDISWHNVDQEFNDFAAKQLQEDMGTLVFGRTTYELMYSYWPNATPSDPKDAIVKDLMDTLPKIVVSHSLENVQDEKNWKNVRVIKDNLKEEFEKLKSEEGKDIAVLGSNNVCVTLLEERLLDEIRIMINPVVIGKGTPLFAGIQDKQKFGLQSTRTFRNGNVLLTYSVTHK